MGRNNKEYSKSMHQQAYDRLAGMQAFGQSKAEAIADGSNKNKIFSYNTYQTYWKHTKYFIAYVKENYPNVSTLGKAEKYVPEFLQHRADQGLSAWTIQTEAKALGKLYGIEPGDKNYYNCPKRERTDIKRSRSDAKRDKHFSKTNNAELIRFCQGTGLRRSELEQLKGNAHVTLNQIMKRGEELNAKSFLTGHESATLKMIEDISLFNGKYNDFLYIKGKGGRIRLSPIIGINSDEIIARIKAAGKENKVWNHVHSNADIHGYRSDYAMNIYRENAREIKDIPYDKINRGTGRKYQSEVYTCRKDEQGKKLDRRAMLIASKALGHNRIEVIANNYIRGL